MNRPAALNFLLQQQCIFSCRNFLYKKHALSKGFFDCRICIFIQKYQFNLSNGVDMGKAWGIGFLGAILIGTGLLLTFFSLLAALFGGDGKFGLPFGIGIMAAGSYMRYLSNQTVRTFTGDSGKSSASISVAIAPGNTSTVSDSRAVDLKKFTNEEMVLSNDSFKLFLLSYYSISKNELLGKFVCKDKIYDSLDDALIYAMNDYKSILN